MNEQLTYQEWLEKYGSKLEDNQFETAQDMVSDFQKLHGLSLLNEIDKINQSEYQLYLQRVDAGVEDV
jgi:phage FluMu gp28-like protein